MAGDSPVTNKSFARSRGLAFETPRFLELAPGFMLTPASQAKKHLFHVVFVCGREPDLRIKTVFRSLHFPTFADRSFKLSSRHPFSTLDC